VILSSLYLLNTIALSSIVVSELLYGAKRKNSLKLEQIVKSFVSNFTILDFDKSASEVYAEIRTYLEKSGEIIGAHDLFIASHAISKNAILAYVAGTDLKIHEVLVWNINEKPKLACSCDNFRLFGNIRTIGTCRHTRMLLYWLSGSLYKFWKKKVYSVNKKDQELVQTRYNKLWTLYGNINRDLESMRYTKEDGGSLWRLSLTNIFVGTIMSSRWLQDFLEEIYAFKEWLREKRKYWYHRCRTCRISLR